MGDVPRDTSLDAFIVRSYLDAIKSATSGGTKAPNAKQQEVLQQAGYTRVPVQVPGKRAGATFDTYVSPDGKVLGPGQARSVAQQIIRNPTLPPRTPPLIPTPGPDTVPVLPPPPGVTLPNRIPGSVALPGWGSVLSRVLGAGVGMLFFPREAGRGSDLRDLYGMPAPTRPRRRRAGRRRRAVPPPGTVPRPAAIPPPAVPRPGTRPVTVSRTRPGTAAQARAAVYQNAGRVLPPPVIASASVPVAIPSVITLPSPIPVPRTGLPVSVPPWLPKVAQFAAPFLLGAVFPAGQVSPRSRPALSPLLQPLTSTQSAAVPYAQPLARTETCKCPQTRSRRKKSCSNPIVRKRKTTRGNKRFITTTREIKCQA